MSVTSSPKGGWFKFLLGWLLSFGLRLIPFRPPNIEAILAVQMPFAKQYGWLAGFFFAFCNIAIFDAVTGKLGLWTLITAAAYGLLAIFSAWYFKKRQGSPFQYAIHAVYATLIYDIVTGLSIGPLFFGQTFQSAVIGQIPFTAYHLLGNVILGALLSPLIFKLVVANPRFEANRLKELLPKLNPSL